jgi:multidrug efflux pump subunit AcrB
MVRFDSLNLPGRISQFFTANRPLSILILIAILTFGLLAFGITPKQYNPEITRPAYLIELEYEGSRPTASIDRVVYELVETIETVPGVEEVNTRVHDGGLIQSTVIFAVGYNSTVAKLDLRSEIEQHHVLTRDVVTEPDIQEVDPENIPVLQIVFNSPTLTTAEVRERVAILARDLGQVEDVSSVHLHGGYPSQLVVALQPERMRAASVGVGQVKARLQNVQERSVYEGVTTDTRRVSFALESAVEKPADFEQIYVTPNVQLGEIARVYQGDAGDRSYVVHDNGVHSGEVITLAVAKVDGSSAPVVTDAVLSRIAHATQREGLSELSYTVVANDGKTATDEIVGLTQNLVTSIAIVAAVLLLFLSVRAALVVMIAIPTTVLIVFGLGWLFDETINRITLFALILSLGLLVDSAIVVVENIYAKLTSSPADSLSERVSRIAEAVHEVGVGLILSVVTSVIVFLPMGYITGMMGPYMGPIAFFVPAALVVSLVVAVVVTPFIAARMLQPERTIWWIQRVFRKGIRVLTEYYQYILRTVLNSRATQRTVLIGALLVFLGTMLLPLTGLVHFQMLPKADRDQLYVYIDAPIDANTQYTRTLATRVTNLITKDPAVKNVQSYIGTPPIVDFNGLFKGAANRDGNHQASVRVNLTAAVQRTRSSVTITQDLRQRIRTSLPLVADQVRFIEEPPGPPVQATFVAKVFHNEPEVRERVTDTLHSTLGSVAGVVDRHIDRDAPVARTTHTFDHTRAGAAGVSERAVSDALALLSGPIYIGEYRNADTVTRSPIMLTLPQELRDAPSNLQLVPVMDATGNPVSLASVLRTTTEVRPSVQTLQGARPVTYLTAEVTNRPIVYVMVDLMARLVRGEVDTLQVTEWGLFTMSLRETTTGESFTIEWGGEWEMTLENFRDLGIAMGVALGLVYLVLVAQYRNFSVPAYILVTVPLALVGILWGFFVLDTTAGIYLTATALIGFIALIGLVVNNAIIFLEYVRRETAQGADFTEALVRAGTARLRPILLTSLTTILGSLTIATDPVWSGLAWAIVFGLSLSTVLTLVIYPTLLVYFTSRDT